MASTRAFPTSGDGELSAWVDKIRQTHDSAAATDSASNLEDEIRQSRLDRQRRRSRLSGAGVRGFKEQDLPEDTGGYQLERAVGVTSIPSSSIDTAASREETLRRLMGDRPSPVTSERPPSPLRGADNAATSASATRAAPLLARYGGQAGPTGVAAVSSSGAPTSLASFMGGRAAGPRLGKLAGDGKSAPPEAALIDQSRHALPGMTRSTTAETGASKPLAAFLAARAGNSSASGNASIGSAGSTPAATVFQQERPLTQEAPSWKRTDSWDRSSPPKSDSASQALARPASPIRATSSSAVPARLPSPTRYKRPVSPARIERPASPVRVAQPANLPTEPAPATLTSQSVQQSGVSRSPLISARTPPAETPAQQPQPAAARKYGATAAGVTPSPASSAAPRKASPYAAAKSEESPPSSDKAPTASLTRLSAQKMVGQRIREAQARAQAESAASPTSPSFRSAGAGKLGVRDRWPEVAASPVPSPASVERKVWTPGRLGNALPGMSRAKSGEEILTVTPSAPARSATVPTPAHANEAESYAPPVRLPGLGGDTVPAAFRRSERAPSPTKATGALPMSDDAANVKVDSAPLQHLAKGRARPPKRGAGSGAAAAVAQSTPSIEQVQQPLPPSNPAPRSPVREAISRMNESVHGTLQDVDDAQLRPASPLRRPISPIRVPPPRSASPVRVHVPNTPELQAEPVRGPSPTRPAHSPSPLSPLKADAQPSSSGEDAFDIEQHRIAVSIPALDALVAGRPVDTPNFSTFSERQAALGSEQGAAPTSRRLKDLLEEVQSIGYDRGAVRAAANRPILTAPSGTISLEVLSIASNGTTTSIPSAEAHILYETEVQAILHRYKSSGGLASTTLYVREGGGASADDGAVRAKLEELAKRFNSPLILGEPPELALLLGGTLIAREGLRKMFEKGDTAMYRVRAENTALYVDQVQLASTSLCSAHSSIVCILGDVYVWYGNGSTPSERAGALSYARTLSSSVVEQEEGQESSLFWAFFDGQSYDSCVHYAHHAQLSAEHTETALFVVDASAPVVSRVVRTAASSAQIIVNLDVPMLVSASTDVFVVIPSVARHDRISIALALEVAEELASLRSETFTLRPPVHVVIFPSAIPTALRNAVRGKWGDEAETTRMNVLTLRAARNELRQRDFAAEALQDEDWLPCGVAPSDIL